MYIQIASNVGKYIGFKMVHHVSHIFIRFRKMLDDVVILNTPDNFASCQNVTMICLDFAMG